MIFFRKTFNFRFHFEKTSVFSQKSINQKSKIFYIWFIESFGTLVLCNVEFCFGPLGASVVLSFPGCRMNQLKNRCCQPYIFFTSFDGPVITLCSPQARIQLFFAWGVQIIFWLFMPPVPHPRMYPDMRLTTQLLGIKHAYCSVSEYLLFNIAIFFSVKHGILICLSEFASFKA